MFWSINNLFSRYTVLAKDGEIGEVHDFLIDDRSWSVRYLAIEVDIIRRNVLIPPAAIDQLDWSQRSLSLKLTKYEVRYSPDIDFDRPVSRQQEIKLHKSYGWPLYWLDKIIPDLRNFGLHPHTLVRVIAGTDTESDPLPYDDVINSARLAEPVARDAVSEEKMVLTEVNNTDNPNLRSVKELMGYGIQARDGAVGHVEDFIIDDNSWTVQLIVVDTQNWLPGNKVLLAPSWIEKVWWSEAKAYVALNRKTIENCPKYNPSALRKGQ